jgi:hypothetical protein
MIKQHPVLSDDYDTLHAAMARAGFSRTIQGSDGVTYHLPWAEYYANTTGTIEQVRNAAVSAANTTGRTSAVLVSLATQIAWQGLLKIRSRWLIYRPPSAEKGRYGGHEKARLDQGAASSFHYWQDYQRGFCQKASGQG